MSRALRSRNVRSEDPIRDVTTGRRRGSALLRGTDAVLLPEREIPGEIALLLPGKAERNLLFVTHRSMGVVSVRGSREKRAL
jgi:hypothetical protein